MQFRKLYAAIAALAALQYGNAQDWQRLPGGDLINNTEWIGADVGSTIPFHLRTIPDLSIDFSTSNTMRMRILPDMAGLTINTYTNQDLSGNVGIGGFNWLTPGQPFSLLHLDGGGIQETGYRPWMRTGITMTEGSDLAYFGIKDEFNDRHHAVIAWADNIGLDGPDLLKFIFTRDPGATGTAAGLHGLEAARIRPALNANESFFGIGDWFTAVDNPTERLDLLDGRARIRQLPDDPEAPELTKVLVVDDSPNPSGERGVIKWRTIPIGGGGGPDCDWTVQANDDVSTAYLANPGCPQMENGVGIGVQSPRAKLHVHHNDFTLLSSGRIGTWSRIEANDYVNQFLGVYGESGPISPSGFVGHVEGVKGEGYNAKTTIGVHGYGRFIHRVKVSALGF